jgi:hypothetical protein
MSRLLVIPACALALLAAPGAAAADVIFDQADADELAATLADAYEAQGVCYGWSVAVDNEGVPQTSVGSNFGAGQSLQDAGAGCAKTVEFTASIVWTPESSESEDSASYGVSSSPGGPTVDDLDDLEIISEGGLEGDDVDVDVYKAVAALPLLAADTGLAKPMEASPAPEADSANEQPTNSPGGDFWRQSGMQILWGALILAAAVVFGWYVVRSSRRPPRPIGPAAEQIPDRPSEPFHQPPAPRPPPGPPARAWSPPARRPEPRQDQEPAPEPAPESAPESAPEPRARPRPESTVKPEPGPEPDSRTRPDE